MTAQEMLKEVEAEEALNQRGYVKENCTRCHGLGYETFRVLPSTDETGLLAGHFMPKCWTCHGSGTIWVKKS